MGNYIDLDYLKKYKSEDILKSSAGEVDAGVRVINTDITDYGILTAESEVDTLLNVRYTVPLTNPSPILKAHVANLAVFYIYNVNDLVPEGIENARKACLEWLEKAANNKIDLIDSNGDLYGDKTEQVKTVNPIKDETYYPDGKDGKFDMSLFNQ